MKHPLLTLGLIAFILLMSVLISGCEGIHEFFDPQGYCLKEGGTVVTDPPVCEKVMRCRDTISGSECRESTDCDYRWHCDMPAEALAK